MRNGKTITGGEQLEVGLHPVAPKSTGRQRREGGSGILVQALTMLGTGMTMENIRNLELRVTPLVLPPREAGGQRRRMKRMRAQEVGKLLATMIVVIGDKLWQKQVPNTWERVSGAVAVGELLARALAVVGAIAGK